LVPFQTIIRLSSMKMFSASFGALLACVLIMSLATFSHSQRMPDMQLLQTNYRRLSQNASDFQVEQLRVRDTSKSARGYSGIGRRLLINLANDLSRRLFQNSSADSDIEVSQLIVREPSKAARHQKDGFVTGRKMLNDMRRRLSQNATEPVLQVLRTRRDDLSATSYELGSDDWRGSKIRDKNHEFGRRS